MPEHPSITRVVSVLRAAGVEGEPRWFDDAVKTAAQAADALGVEVGAIANSLVFTLDGAPILVMTSGSHRVDTAWLGEQLGGVIGRADAAVVSAATGQVIGGVAPVGHPEPLPTWVDTQLASFPQIWAAAGHAHAVFPLTFDELLALTNGTPTDVVPPSP